MRWVGGGRVGEFEKGVGIGDNHNETRKYFVINK